MSDIHILMTVPLPSLVIDALEKKFTLHKLWEADDTDAFIAGVSGDVRAIVTAVPILAEGKHVQVDGDLMGRFPKLELVANLGVGYDNIDANWAAGNGIAITNTPDVLTEETADTAFGLILNAVREFSAAERYLRAGKWLEKPFRLTGSLRDKTLGILGLGRIGTAIARRAEGFGLKIAYHSRHEVKDSPYAYCADPVSLAKRSDIYVIVVPGGPDTNNLVGKDVFEALGPDGYLINIARGTIVDEPALIRALQNCTIAGAGLDVFAKEPEVPPELLAMDNVALLPHVGSASRDTRDAMSRLVVDNVTAWSRNEPLLTPV